MSSTNSVDAASNIQPPPDVSNRCPGIAGRICPVWDGTDDFVTYVVAYRPVGKTTFTEVTTTADSIIIQNLNPLISYEFTVTGVTADGTEVLGVPAAAADEGSVDGSVVSQAGGGIKSANCKSSSSGEISCDTTGTDLKISRIALKLECVGKKLGKKFVYRRNWVVYKTTDIKRVLQGPKIKSACTLWVHPYYLLDNGGAFPGTRITSKFSSNARNIKV